MSSREAFLENIISGSNLWQDSESRKQVKANDRNAYKSLLVPFRKYQKHHVVGALVDMLNALGTNVSRETWEEWYREECNRRGKKGLLTEISWELWHDVQFTVEPARVFSFVVNRVLDETYDGVQTENLAKEMIATVWNPHNYMIRHATRFEEADYSIDFIVEDKAGQIVKAYQVKPDTFFSNTVTKDRNPSLFEDRISNCRKMFALAKGLQDAESVEFLKKSDLENGEFSPLPISVFDTNGNIV